MSKLNKKIKSKKGAISAIALLIAMGLFGGATVYTLNGFSEGHEETTIGVGSELNAIIPDPNVYVPVTHAAIPVIQGHNLTDTALLEGEHIALSMTATIRDNGELSYRWMQRKEGSLHYQEVGTGSSYTHVPTAGAYYLYGEAINTNANVNGEQVATTKTPEVSLIVLAKAQEPTIEGIHDFVTQYNTEVKTYKITGSTNDTGVMSYKWYQSTNASGANPVLVGSTDTLTINKANVGIYYYYAEVTNKVTYPAFSREHSTTKKSDVMTIEVVKHSTAPSITNLVNKVIPSGTPQAFTINAASLDGGTLSYKWYESDANSRTGARLLSGSTTASLTVNHTATTQAIQKFYFVDVVNTFEYIDSRGGVHVSQATANSNIARLEVFPKAVMPSVGNISDIITTTGNANVAATASVTDGGAISYEWYETTTKVNTGGTKVGAANTLSLTNLPVGPKYYYVKVSNSKPYTAVDGTVHQNVTSKVSNAVRVERINEAQMPTLSSLANKVNVSGTPVNYAISANKTDSGILTYKWFEHTANAYAGTVKYTASGSYSFAPTIETGAMTRYYYVEVTNTLHFKDSVGVIHTSSKTARSNIARIETYATAQVPVIDNIPDQNIETSTATINANATVTDGGTLTYQWYKATGNTNATGTPLTTTGKTANLTGLTIGAHYYYVEVINSKPYTSISGTVYPNNISQKSPAVRIERIQTAQVPTIGTLANRVEASGTEITFDSQASVTDGGTLTYSWLEMNESSEVGNQIGTASTVKINLTAQNAKWTVKYYKFIVTNTFTYTDATGYKHITTEKAISNTARVEIYPSAETPVIGALANKVLRSGTPYTYSAQATVGDSGTLTYKWFVHTSNAYAGTQSGTAKDYTGNLTAPTAAVVRYIWVEVENTKVYTDLSGKPYTTKKSARSNISRLEIFTPAAAPVLQVIPNQEISRIYTDITVTATVPDAGTITYQWYKNTVNSNTGGTAISGATGKTLSVNNLPVGANFFYVVATNSKPYTAVDGTVHQNITPTTSNTVRIEVIMIAKEPVVENIANKVIESGDSVIIDVDASAIDDGTLTYEWYLNSTNAYGGTVMGSSKSFNKSFTTGSTATKNYYYVNVINTLNFKDSTGKIHTTTASKKSNIGVIEVYPNAAQPVLQSLADQVVKVASANVVIEATSSDGGALSYQWFKPATKVATGGTAVGTNNKTLSLTNIPVGPHYYYVRVINTKGYVALNGVTYYATSQAISNPVRIERVPVAVAPTVGTLTNHVFPSGTGTTFNASATKTDAGVLTYKWYEHALSTYNGNVVGSAATYSVTKTVTSGALVQYYWVDVTNTLTYNDSVGQPHVTTASTRSNIARVETYAIAKTPAISAITDRVVQGTTASITASVTTGDSGTLTYRWFKTTTKTNTGGTPIGTNSATLSLSALAIGPTYYYVEVENNVPYTSVSGTVYPNSRTSKSNAFRVERVPVAVKPTVGTLVNKVNESGSVLNYDIGAATTDDGVLTYKWYEHTSNAYGGGVVTTTPQYSRTQTTGDTTTVKYVWVEVINTLNFIDTAGVTQTTTASERSNIVRVEIYPKAKAVTIGNIQDSIINGTTFSVSANITPYDSGVLTYKWFKVTSKVNAGGTLLSGNSSSTLNLTGLAIGATYYYLEVLNTRPYTSVDGVVYESHAVQKSNPFRVERIREAATPIVQSINGGVFESGSTLSLNAVVSDVGEGVLTYKWYENTTNAFSGTVVGTSSSYSKLLTATTAPVVRYYYVNVLNTYQYTDAEGTIHTTTKNTNSNIIRVETHLKAAAPTVGSLANKVLLSGVGANYSITASSTDGGTLSYKWYENTANAYSGTVKATTATYNPILNVTTPTTRYYWVEVTNSLPYTALNGTVYYSRVTGRSNIAKLEVYPKATKPVIGNIANQLHAGNSINTSLAGTVTGHNGALTYEWFKTTSAVTTGGAKVGSASTLSLTGLTGGIYYYYLKATNTYSYTSGSGTVYTDVNSSVSNAVIIDIVKQAQKPTISTLSNRVVLSGTAVSFSAGATSPDGGTLTYEWYENTTSATGGTKVGTAATYSVTKTASTGALVRYYTVVVTNTVNVTDSTGTVHTTTNNATSNIARVETYAPAQAPVIPTINAQNVTGTTATVTASPSVTDGGTLTYQWFKTTTATTTGGTQVGTASSLSVTGLTIGAHYYYVRVTNTKTYTSISGSTHPHSTAANSNSVRIERIQSASTPAVGTLTNQILKSGAEHIFNSGASVSDGGTLSYKWYEHTSNAYAGTVVGTSATYTAKKTVTAPTVLYYYVEVTNSYTYTDAAGATHPTVSSIKSNIARVEFYPEANAPTVSAIDSKVLKTGTAFTWTPAVTGNNGTLSYKWYENTVNATGGTEVGTANSFTKTLTTTTTPVVRYYSLLVTNTYTFTSIAGTNFTTTATKWSNIARVEVYPAANIPVVGTLPNAVRKSGVSVSWSAPVSPTNGSLSYTWYESTSSAGGGASVSTASSLTRTISTGTPLTRYYSLKVVNTYSYTSLSGTVHSDSQTTWSNVARLEVYPAVTTPTIASIADQQYKTNNTTVTVNPMVGNSNGTLSYQWYETTSRTTTGGTLVGTASSLSRTGQTPGYKYYYLKVTNTYTYNSVANGPFTQTASAVSNSFVVDVIKQATIPAAFTLPNRVQKSGNTSAYFAPGSPDGGVPTYKWYENTVNAFGGTQISTSNGINLNKTTTTGALILYYSATVTNTVYHNDSKGVQHVTSQSRNSNVARVEFFPAAQAPTVGNITSKTTQTSTSSITATASVTDGGTLSYEWFKTTSAVTTGGTKQTATTATLSLTGLTVGPHYYYVVVTNSKPYTATDGSTHYNVTSTTSNSVRVERVQTAASPVVGSLSNQVLKTGISATFSAGASTTDGGTLSYSWKVSTTDAYSGTAVGTASSYTYSKAVTSPSTEYVYVEVTNTYIYTDAAGTKHTTTAMTRSNRARVEVYPTATQVTIGSLADKVVKSGVTNRYDASVTGHNGTLSYTWYENTTAATGGTSKGTASYYHASVNTSSPVVRYYSVLVKNTYSYTSVSGTVYTDQTSKWSNIAKLEVFPLATSPTLSAIGDRVVTSGTAVTFSVTATGYNGTIQYQWYENTVNATGGSPNGISSSRTVTHTTTSDKTLYYNVKVLNTYNYTAQDGSLHYDIAIVWSNVARLEVYAPAILPTVGTIANKTILPPGNTSLSVTASTTDGGTLSYKWFQTTSATTTGGTVIGTNSATLNLTGLGVGNNYFYVEVTNSKSFTSASGTVYPSTQTRKSNAVTVTVLLNAQTPTLGTLSNRVNVSTAPITLSIGASVTDGGTLSYKWYSNTTNAVGGTVVGTAATFNAAKTVTSPSKLYYFVEVTNTRNYTDSEGVVHTDTAMARSNIAVVEVYPDATTPVVGALAHQVMKTGVSASWTASVTGHNGTLSYKWYENTTNATGGTVIGTSATQTRAHTVTSATTRYISVFVTNTYSYTDVSGNVSSVATSVWSNVARFEIYPAATTPTVATLAHQVKVSGASASWTASVSGHNGSVSYQWYERTTNATGGTALGTSATQSKSYTVSSNTIRYISVLVTNTYTFTSASGTKYTDTATKWSNVARFEIYPAATTPTVTISGSQTVKTGQSATFTSSVSGNNGSVSYQWYENASNTTGGTKKGTGTTQAYSNTSVVTHYVSLYVTNTYSYTSVSGTVYTSSASKYSGVSVFKTYTEADTPSISGVGSSTTYNGSWSKTATATGNGTKTFSWTTGHTTATGSASGLGLGAHSYSVTVTNTLTSNGKTTSKTATASFTITSKWMVVATDDDTPVNARSGPGTGYSVVAKYDAGTRITALHSITNAGGYAWNHVTVGSSNVYIADGTTIRGSGYLEEVTSSTAVKFTTSSLNLRHSPSGSGGLIVTMPSGAKVYHLRITNNGWYRVLYISGSTWYVGWASGTYLRN